MIGAAKRSRLTAREQGLSYRTCQGRGRDRWELKTIHSALPMRTTVLALLALLALGCNALRLGAAPIVQRRALSPICGATAQPETKTRTRQKTSDGGGKGGGGGGAPTAAVAKPKRKTHIEDVPMWKVILLGDDEYEEDSVCTVLHQVIPDIENQRQARERYEEAMSTGRSLLLIQPKEQAEFFVEQLARCDPQMVVYSKLEEE